MGFTAENTTDTVPLEGWQQARLMFDCVPFVAFLIITFVILTALRDLFKSVPPSALYGFIGLVLLATGFDAVQRIRDLISGTAQIQTDILERSWRSHGRGSARFYGRFTSLGKLRLMRKAFFGSQNNTRYHIVYSPISRIVWTLDELP